MPSLELSPVPVAKKARLTLTLSVFLFLEVPSVGLGSFLPIPMAKERPGSGLTCVGASWTGLILRSVTLLVYTSYKYVNLLGNL